MLRLLCPAPGCHAALAVDRTRLGRNVDCPACGWRFTARPPEVEVQLRRQQARLEKGAGGSGAAGPESAAPAGPESAATGIPSPVARLPFAVLVDSVRSLWNVGALFRTADACGVRELVLAGITGHPPRPEITKTALGAEEAVPWRYRADPAEALAELVGEGYIPVALEAGPRAVPLDQVAWPAPLCLVVGNEVAGITPAVLDACPVHAVIPMRGVKSSLNVAVAFGIAAHAAATALARQATSSSPGPPAAPAGRAARPASS